MKKIKENAIRIQKKVIAELRENSSCESSRENAIAKLNFIVDDYEKDNNVIDKENINLYYEFMSDEDLEKYKEILTELFQNRYSQVFENVNLHVSHLAFKIIEKYYYVGQSFFGAKDTLRPIKEFISEIKEREEYISYMQDKEKKTKEYN